MKLDKSELRELITLHLKSALGAAIEAEPKVIIAKISRALDLADELNNEENRHGG